MVLIDQVSFRNNQQEDRLVSLTALPISFTTLEPIIVLTYAAITTYAARRAPERHDPWPRTGQSGLRSVNADSKEGRDERTKHTKHLTKSQVNHDIGGYHA